MAKIYVTQGNEGGYLARTPLLLGAVAYEPNESESVAAVIRRVEEQAAIYRELNLPLPDGYPPTEWSVETVPDATIPEDYVPLDNLTLNTGLMLLEHSHRRLLEVIDRFSPEALRWPIPDAKRFKTAEEVLDHVAHADTWYISRLHDWPREPAARLKAIRAAISSHIEFLSTNDLNRKTYNYLEEWTPRKALRLVLESVPPSDLLEGLAEFQRSTETNLPSLSTERPCIWLNHARQNQMLKVYLRSIDWTNRYYAAIAQFPGLAIEGATRDQVIASIPALVADGLAYLERIGQSIRSIKTNEFKVMEIYSTLFPEDELPLTATDLPPYFDAIESATRQQAAFLEQLPREVWEWKTPKGRSLRTIALNWANQEWWYLRCLQDWPHDPIERLRGVRAWVIERYRNLSPDERTRVTLHIGEEWTARKALRRAIEHEREHRWHIEEILDQYYKSRAGVSLQSA